MNTSFPPGHLGANLMHFARTLRAAGLPIGSGAVLDALRAVEAVGVTRRDDFYWTLHAVFVRRADQRPLFDEAFHVFWRNPKLLERVTSLLLPTIHVPPQGDARPLSRRLSEALFAGAEREARTREAEKEIEFDATLTWSDREVLRSRDFEQMSAVELATAKAAIARLRLAIPPAPTRRYRPHPRGSLVDMRTTLRRSLRSGSGTVELARRKRRQRPSPLVVLCDISGSMSRYSRVLLHFAHALARDRTRVSSFVFGTRLTNITRQLRDRDVDAAVERASAEVADWDGGTRIGPCLDTFNREWSRRVCGQGAVVLLITDGLDREVGEGVGPGAERLRKSCRRLIWLNPLLRYERFEPKAAGMRALLPHVHELRPVHNLENLEDLCTALVTPGG
ncbi:MAG: VWA domain-containing protein [Thiotrichales bacterium]|nr:VWA domain-containing protein [Thiotrichales bacterium]